MEFYTVYMHIFPNGKHYIGITRQLTQDRWGKQGQGYKRQPVYQAILEFGWDNIQHVVIEEGLTLDEAQKMERELICQFDSIEHGYNVSTGGGAGGDSWCEFELDGIVYSASEIAEMSVFGITAHDITTRVRSRGWSLEKAMTTPKVEKGKKYCYQGNYYTTVELLQFALVDGLTVQHLITRLNKYHWDVERALTQPLNVKKQPSGMHEKNIEYNGAMYNTYELAQMSTVEGITPSDIYNRIIRKGWSVEKALTQQKVKRNTLYEYQGHLYTTKQIAEMCIDNRITHHHITDRLAKGWTIEQCITTPLNT